MNEIETINIFKNKLITNVSEGMKMLSENSYLSKKKTGYSIIKQINGINKSFGFYKDLDEARRIRDRLVEADWDIEKLDVETKQSLKMRKIDTPYGKYIYREGKTFRLDKTIGNERIIFARSNDIEYLKELRNELIKVDWNIDLLSGKFKDLQLPAPKTGKYGKYITKSGEQYRISKYMNGKYELFGYYDTLEEATEVRDLLVKNNWDITSVQDHLNPDRAIYRKFNKGEVKAYEIMKRIDGEMKYFGSYSTIEEARRVRDTLEANRWKNLYSFEDDSLEEKYDENIYRIGEKYFLKKEFDGEMIIFGVFDDPFEAIDYRLECIKKNWDFDMILNEIY